jgi:hypothetical protein
MKRSFLFAARFCAVFLGGMLTVFAQDHYFILDNETGYTIDHAFVAADDSEDWGEDILDDAALPNGESVRVTFASHVHARYVDLRIVFENGRAAECGGLDLSRMRGVRVSYRAGEAVATLLR